MDLEDLMKIEKAPANKQIRKLTKDPKIRALVEGCSILVAELAPRLHTIAGAKELEKEIVKQVELELGGVASLADSFRHAASDTSLRSLSDHLAHVFFPKGFEQSYIIKSRCEKCTEQLKKPIVFRTEIGPKIITDYVLEEDFRNGILEGEFPVLCPYNKTHVLEVSSTANVYKAIHATIVYEISARLKSAGRLAAKFADVICYEDAYSNIYRLRNLFDVRGIRFVPMTLPPKIVSKSRHKKVRQAVLEYQKTRADMRRAFEREFGMKLPRGIEDEELQNELCTGIQRKLKRLRLVSPKVKVDNKIRRPTKEGYRHIQSVLNWGGVLVESQVVPHDIHLASKDPASRIYHPTYSEIEEELRSQIWEQHPKFKVVNDIFEKILNGMYD